jgi:hypothetical protein
MLQAIAIGTITDTPSGTDSYTLWKIRVFDIKISAFSRESVMGRSRDFCVGDRVRIMGSPSWKDYQGEWQMTLGQCGVDLSDAGDELKLKVDGTFSHPLKVQQDEAGSSFIKLSIESPSRKQDKTTGEWYDGTTTVLINVLHQAVEGLVALHKAGTKEFLFDGELSEYPRFTQNANEPVFELYANYAGETSKARSFQDFWSEKPVDLAAKRAAMSKPKPPRKGGGAQGRQGGPGAQGRLDTGERYDQTTGEILDDGVPF